MTLQSAASMYGGPIKDIIQYNYKENNQWHIVVYIASIWWKNIKGKINDFISMQWGLQQCSWTLKNINQNLKK